MREFGLMMRDNKGWLLVVLMCLGFMAAACSTNNATVSGETAAACQDDGYRLGTGDGLRITVFGQEDLSREVGQRGPNNAAAYRRLRGGWPHAQRC